MSCETEILQSIPYEAYESNPEGARAYASKVCGGGRTVTVWGTRVGGLIGDQAESVLIGVGQLLTPFQGPAEIAGNIALLPLGSIEAVSAAKIVPLLGRNVRYAGSRALTDLPGGLATARSIFRNFPRGLEIEQFPYKNGGVRRVAPNGYQIRIEPNGTVRIDAPRGPLGRETIHFWP